MFNRLISFGLILLLVTPALATPKKDKKKKKAPVVYTALLLDQADETKSSGITINYSYEIKGNLIYIFNTYPNLCTHKLFETKINPDLEEDHYSELGVKKSDPRFHLIPYPSADESTVYFEADDSSCMQNMIMRQTQVGAVKNLFRNLKNQSTVETNQNMYIALFSLVTFMDIERKKAADAAEEAQEKKKK